MQQMNGRDFLFRFGKYALIPYALVGVLLVWKFDRSLSFFQSIAIALYVGLGIVLRQYVTSRNSSHLPKQQAHKGISKEEKAKIIADVLKIFACFVAGFIVMTVGTLANPKTETGFLIFFEVPIIILILLILALIARIFFRLFNMKRYFRN